ncbi:TRAP transporter small permease subunit [Mesobacterium pallidum]|uniref:TRAP transporter small permease subunit n=1 Tax=Mesobacterium pallidum TaxID=2872037 RepID=UPI001EE17DF1|nr:TRAP transporter small permease [Mesobacterium pallidum]
MRQFHFIVTKMADALFAVSLVFGFLMMAHVTADVVARTVFNAPLPGTGEISASWYMVAVAFLPLGYVTLRDQHVTADIFVSRMSPGRQAMVEVLTDLLSMAYLTAFVWQTWESAMKNTKRGEVWEILGGYLPIWPVRWFLPAAGVVMLLAFLSRLLSRATERNLQTRN